MKLYKWRLTWWTPVKQVALFNRRKDASVFQEQMGIRIARYEKGTYFKTEKTVFQS